MAQEEQSQKCSNSGSSIGRSNKKGKQKKVPQRGLGVAQLEKIRIEEQHKKDASSSLIFPNPSSAKSSFLSVSLPNFHHSNQPSSSSSSINPPPILHTIDGSHSSSTVPLPNSLTWPPNVPKLWSSSDYSLEKEGSGLAFHSSMSLPYESNPLWHLQSLMPRSQPFQEPSSMVNVSSAPCSSSVLNFQMEPPSNQSYYGNFRPMWPDEEKIVGMKRSYPFSMENHPGPSFHCKLPTIAHPMNDEPASCGNNVGAFTLEPSHPIFREVPSCSKKINENSGFGGDFLTLGPPAAKLPDFDSLPYQGSAEEPMFQTMPSGWNPQPALYSFLPLAKVQASQATTSINGEVGETIDLNLKL